MATQSTPILQDNSLQSVAVTQLFKAGSLFARSASVETLRADEAAFETVTVTNLIVSGTASSTNSDPSLGLLPNQLVATNGSGQPVSFPYGDAAGEIAIRNSNGSASFTSWTTPANTTQFFLSTGNGVGIQVLFNSVVDSVLTIPDVGADANVVIYGTVGMKNVIDSGDNILHLKSTDNRATIQIGTVSGFGSILGHEFQVAGSTGSAIRVNNIDTQLLSLVNDTSAIKFSIAPNGATSTVSVGGTFQPIVTLFSDLSNGNLNGFKSVFLTKGSAAINNFTSTLSVSNNGPCVLVLNATASDSILPMASKSATWNNGFITTGTRFLTSILDVNGTINGVGVGVPYVIVTAVGSGTCTLTTYNLSPLNTMTVAITVAVMILP